MGVFVTDNANAERNIPCNWWNWRPTVEILRGSGVSPDKGWDALSSGIGKFNAEQTLILIEFLQNTILSTLHKNEWITMDKK